MGSESPRASSWGRLKEAFATALELQLREREALLTALASEDSQLGRDLADMLAAHERAESAHATAACDEPATGEALPSHVGRYRVVRLLGQGGMGRVLLAHDPDLDRDVALKLLPAPLAGAPDHRSRLLREARAAAGLNHPAITTVHEVGRAEGLDYIAMEYVEGPTLRELLEHHRLAPDELLDLALPLAEALAFAHRHDVLHRDVKATNVMVPWDGPPRLLDFGLARSHAGASADGQTITLEGAVFGTPGAMSPEQALGRPLDDRSDVFSFGSLLYEMATGQRAFQGDTSMATIDAVIHAPAPPIDRARDDLREELVQLVEQCLQKDPDRRPASMDDVAERLRVLRDGGAAPVHGRPVTRGRRGLVFVAAVALGALAWWLAGLTGMSGGPAGTPQVAVLSFRDLDHADDAQQLGAMLARLVTDEVGAGAELSMVSQQRLFDVARMAGLPAGIIPADHVTRVARDADVDIMLLGQVGQAGSQLVATVDVVEVSSGRSLGSPAARGRSVDDVFALATELGRAVRSLLAAPDLTAEERSALDRRLTTSVSAYRAYVRGQRLLQANDIPGAVAAFREATEEDAGFALAHFRLATALVWTGDDEGPQQAIERALAFRDHLPTAMRGLLDAAVPYYFDDDTRAALPHLERVLEADPWQRDALYMLGEIATHSATRNDVGRATEVYERLLSVEPGFSLVYEHAVSADLRAGRSARAAGRVDAWRSRVPDEARALDALIALWEGRLDDARSLRPDDRVVALLVATEEPAADIGPAAPAWLGSLDGLYRCVAFDLEAAAHVYSGRLDAAAATYEEAVEVVGAQSLDGFLTNARAGARHHLAELLALQGDGVAARREVDAALAIQPESYRCLYLATVFAAREGDAEAVAAHVVLLDELVARGWSPTARLYRDAARAEQLLLAGRNDEARALLEPLVDSGRLMEDWYAYEDSMGTPVRQALARACRSGGDPEGERAALRGLVDSGLERLRHPVTWLLALYRLGVLAHEAGDEPEARAHLDRFLDHWGEVDLAEVRDAERRLGR